MVLLLLSKVTQRHFWHSASKVHCALPRAQHGICSPIPCWCSLISSRTQRIAHARNTLFMWTISSLARTLWKYYVFALRNAVVQTARNIFCGRKYFLSIRNASRAHILSLLPPPRPPFSRRRLCICGDSYHISDDTAQVTICIRRVKTPSLFIAYFFSKCLKQKLRFYKKSYILKIMVAYYYDS